MNNNIVRLAAFTWLGMVALPILGWFISGSGMPPREMECPTYVWDMIEEGSLTRGEITESLETMKNYDCKFVYAEQEPFNPTNWLLFGIVTGFMTGTFFLGNPRPMIVKIAHHGESEECRNCYYSTGGRSTCPCPECVQKGQGQTAHEQTEARGTESP